MKQIEIGSYIDFIDPLDNKRKTGLVFRFNPNPLGVREISYIVMIKDDCYGVPLSEILSVHTPGKQLKLF